MQAVQERSVDRTGLVWQTTPRGDQKIIGEVYVTRAGRFYVVMVGRRIASSLRTFEEARTAALGWEPAADEVDVLATILRGYR